MTALARRPTDYEPVVHAINGLSEADLDRFNAWQPLADLSSYTTFDVVDADPDSIVSDATGNFEAIATVYVTLVYGSGDDQERMSDEYVATVRGRLAHGEVTFDTIDVDTTPFYE